MLKAILFIEKYNKKIIFIYIFFLILTIMYIFFLVNNIPQIEWVYYGIMCKKIYNDSIIYPLKSIIFQWVLIYVCLQVTFIFLLYTLKSNIQNNNNNNIIIILLLLFCILLFSVYIYYILVLILSTLHLYTLDEYIVNAGILYNSKWFIIVHKVTIKESLIVVKALVLKSGLLIEHIPVDHYEWITHNCLTFGMAEEYVNYLHRYVNLNSAATIVNLPFYKKVVLFFSKLICK